MEQLALLVVGKTLDDLLVGAEQAVVIAEQLVDRIVRGEHAAARPEAVDGVQDHRPQAFDRPVVVEFRTDPRENVFPMVPAGKTNSELVVDPSQQGLER